MLGRMTSSPRPAGRDTPPFSHRGRLARAFVATVAALLCLAPTLGRSAELAEDDGTEVTTLAAEALRQQNAFRKAETDEERARIARILLILEADGGRRLHAVVRTELVKRIPAFAAAAERAAAGLLKQRAGGGDVTAEIATLRQTIRDVAAAANLTKEMIVEKSDPALARLEELNLVTPGEILAADPELVGEQDALLQLAAWGEQAAELLPERDRRKLPSIPGRDDLAAQLEGAVAAAATMAAPFSPADRQTLAANEALVDSLDPEEVRGIRRLNEIRLLVGLPAQATDLKLVAACRTHSEDMCREGFFAHESPVSGRETPWKRAQAAGTTASAENIAAGTDSGEGAVQMWWHSPGHHKNMLGGQPRTGLGRYERHWTQLFG
jgi:uncharacterized protein YkwD